MKTIITLALACALCACGTYRVSGSFDYCSKDCREPSAGTPLK